MKRVSLVSGVGLLELVIAIAILGLVATVTIPRFFKSSPQQDRKTFVHALNAIVTQAWVNTLTTATLQKIIVDPINHFIWLEQKTGEGDSFTLVPLHSFKGKYRYSDSIDIRGIYVEGVDEIGRHGAESTVHDIWFFIMPGGIAQEVIINAIDTKDQRFSIDGKEFSLLLNPVKVHFEEHDAFIKPSL